MVVREGRVYQVQAAVRFSEGWHGRWSTVRRGNPLYASKSMKNLFPVSSFQPLESCCIATAIRATSSMSLRLDDILITSAPRRPSSSNQARA